MDEKEINMTVFDGPKDTVDFKSTWEQRFNYEEIMEETYASYLDSKGLL